jgi:glycosyltransferase involved in cell wall biosynthesis
LFNGSASERPLAAAQGARELAEHRGVKASILIAAGDGVAATMNCLRSIAATIDPAISFEVVLVDDGTDDGTAAALAGVGGDFRMLRNAQPRGSAPAWLQAAAIAGGEYLVIVDQHATVERGWLAALLNVLEYDGAVSSVRARGLAGGGRSACVALRAAELAGLSAAEGEALLRGAHTDALVVAEAVVATAGAADEAPAAPGGPELPALRDIGGLGTFFATRLGGDQGDVLFCSNEARAREDLSRSAAVAIVTAELGEGALAAIAAKAGLGLALSGRTATVDGSKQVPLTILDRWSSQPPAPTPQNFRVLAVVTAYNERDVITQSIGHLLENGVEVHLLDNWSSDGTFELVEEVFGERVTRERFPASGPSDTYDWIAILDRVEAITREHACDWSIHQDADELRESPWPGVSLRDALYRVSAAGFNCVDHTVVNFRPVDDAFVDGADLKTSFAWCEFAAHQSDFLQLKAWSAPGAAVGLAIDGGHQVRFAGRRIYPYKFLLRHYPIRSQRHGERKVLRERQTRWNAAERARGWHVHYDGYNAASSFLWDPAGLLCFDAPSFMDEYIVERISGVGLSAAQAGAHAQIQAALAA